MEMSQIFRLRWGLSLEPFDYFNVLSFVIWDEPEEIIALVGNVYPNQFMTTEDFEYVKNKGYFTSAGREYWELDHLRYISLHLQSLNALINHVENLSKYKTLDIRKEPPMEFPNNITTHPSKAHLRLAFSYPGDHSYSFQLDARHRDLPKTDIKVEDFLDILSTLSHEITKALKARE